MAYKKRKRSSYSRYITGVESYYTRRDNISRKEYHSYGFFHKFFLARFGVKTEQDFLNVRNYGSGKTWD